MTVRLIDDTTRANWDGWDIGADEFTPSSEDTVRRSIGISTDTLEPAIAMALELAARLTLS